LARRARWGLPAMSHTFPTRTRIFDLSIVDARQGWVLGTSCTASGDRRVRVLRGTTDSLLVTHNRPPPFTFTVGPG
jgi:hypothetical protein